MCTAPSVGVKLRSSTGGLGVVADAVDRMALDAGADPVCPIANGLSIPVNFTTTFDLVRRQNSSPLAAAPGGRGGVQH